MDFRLFVKRNDFWYYIILSYTWNPPTIYAFFFHRIMEKKGGDNERNGHKKIV